MLILKRKLRDCRGKNPEIVQKSYLSIIMYQYIGHVVTYKVKYKLYNVYFVLNQLALYNLHYWVCTYAARIPWNNG